MKRGKAKIPARRSYVVQHGIIGMTRRRGSPTRAKYSVSAGKWISCRLNSFQVAKLDELLQAMRGGRVKAGIVKTRSDVVRWLIQRAYARMSRKRAPTQ